MGWMLRHPHGSSRQASAWSGRLKVNRGFQGLQCPRSRHQDLLSGFERPSRGSLFSISVLVRGALGRGSRAYSSAG
jgi:hypothetical protein